jgi:hypothetical protein
MLGLSATTWVPRDGAQRWIGSCRLSCWFMSIAWWHTFPHPQDNSAGRFEVPACCSDRITHCPLLPGLAVQPTL